MTAYKENSNITIGKKIVIISSGLTIISFFLPWITEYIEGIIPWNTFNGFFYATMGESALSGLPGWPYFATLITALACLCSSAMYIKRKYPNRLVPIAQTALAVIGLLPFILLKIEIGHYFNIAAVARFGLWLTLMGLFGMIVGSVRGILQKE